MSNCCWPPWAAACKASQVHLQLLGLAQIHFHQVGDDIQPSYPLSSPSPSAFNPFPASRPFPMSWLFTLGSQSIGASASILPMYIQDILLNLKSILKDVILKLRLQYFGHLMWRADSLEKTLTLGKIEDRRRGRQRMRWLDGITESMNIESG